ncbi:MAG: hypothetical protein H6811_08155 [Phycisphaeraceae bacterium]|nr:hypothetical protein [Phycisphaeraceae bacterium]
MSQQQHGIEAEVVPEGILFRSADQLRSIQIEPDSVVWGVWSQRSPGDTRSLPNIDEPSDLATPHGSHLILSPLHPDTWLAAFKVTAHLRDEPGTIESALRVLERLGINILTTRCTFARYHQTKFMATCELPGLRDTLMGMMAVLGVLETSGKGDIESVRQQQSRLRLETMRTAGYWMLAALSALEAQFCADDAEARSEGNPFLSESLLERGSLPWYINGLEWSSLDEFWRKANAASVFSFLSADSGEKASARDRAHFGELFERYFRGTRGRNVGERFEVLIGSSHNTQSLEALWYEQGGGNPESGEPPWSHWATDYLRRQHMAHWTLPIECQALLRLAYCGVYRDYRRPPLKFRLREHARGCLLALDSPKQSRRSDPDMFATLNTMHALGERSTRFGDGSVAMVSIADDEAYARVRFIRPQVAATMCVRVEVSYEVLRTTKSEERMRPPIGMLRAMISAAHSQDGNVERITNVTHESDPDRERGRIEVVIIRDWRQPVFDAWKGKDPSRWRDAVRSAIDSAIGSYAKSHKKEFGVRVEGITVEWLSDARS